jgi:Fic family protein
MVEYTPVKYHIGEFPPQNLKWERIIPFLSSTSAALARYDGLLSAIPNAHVLLSPLTTQEAVLSSKIEGTHVTIGEVLEFEAGNLDISESKRDDAEEVLNYRIAMRGCIAELENREFSQHILRTTHHDLMQGVRGKDKSPGAYRTEQNWIGPKGSTIDTASFIPAPIEHLQSGMDIWEKFFNDVNQPDPLVQLALLHIEFEALHPFKDGNGRLGRMVIPLFLYKRKLLQSPDFYMSGYLEANREEYHERLRDVSRSGSWTDWCVFFLSGIREQAIENEKKARAILHLYEKIKQDVINLTHSQHAIQAVDYLFNVPIFTPPQFTNHSGIPKPSTARILKILQDNEILSILRPGQGRRAGILAFGRLINIVEAKDIF